MSIDVCVGLVVGRWKIFCVVIFVFFMIYGVCCYWVGGGIEEIWRKRIRCKIRILVGGIESFLGEFYSIVG